MNLSRLPAFALCLFAVMAGTGTFAVGADSPAAKFMEDGQARFDKRDYAGAIIQSKNAVQADRNHLPGLVLLGKSLLKMGDAVGAEVTLTDALSRGVGRSEVLPALAQALVGQGKHKQIFDPIRFDLAGMLPGAQAQLHLARATAYFDLGEREKSFSSIALARSLDPHSPEPGLTEAPIRIAARQFAEAKRAADEALSAAPRLPEAWFNKAAVLHATTQSVQALAAYSKAIELDPDLVSARLARASLLVDLGRIDEAAPELIQVKRLRPSDPKAAYLRALIAEKQGKSEEARLALKEVTELLDGFPMDYIRFRPQVLMLNGLAHSSLKEPEKAKVYFEAFQKVLPEAPIAKLLAQIYLQSNDYERATDVLEKYLKAHPSDGHALALLGSALMAKGQTARAAALMQQTLQSGESPEMRTVLGLSLMRSGQTESAIKELETALKSAPGKPHASAYLLLLYVKNGQLPKALALAEKLAKDQQKNPSIHNLLGLVRIRAGDVAGARAAFEKASAIDANFVAPKLNLARIDIVLRSYEAAGSGLAQVLALEPKNAEAMFELGVLAERRGLMGDALAWLKKAHDHSGHKEARYALALSDFYLRTGRSALALDAAKDAASRDTNDLAATMALAKALLANQNFASARSSLVAASIAAGNDAAALVKVAALQVAAKNPGDAFYSAEKALVSTPNFLPAMAFLADLDLQRADFSSAERRARDIVSKHPNRGLGHKLLGDALSGSGRSQLAVGAYRKSQQLEPRPETVAKLVKLMPAQPGQEPLEQFAAQWLKEHPKDVLVFQLLADHLVKEGKLPQARLALEGWVKAAPQDGRAITSLAQVLVRLNDPAAVSAAELAVAKDPTNAAALDSLGWILVQKGQAQRAVGLLLDAKMREPLNLEVRYHLAVALAQSDDKAQARRELEAALRSKKQFASLEQAQALLKTLP